MHNEEKVWQELAEKLVGICLSKLSELGKVELEQVDGKWYVEFNAKKLEDKGFAGAATLDKYNCPVVYLSPQLNIEGLVEVISHEAIHLIQICKGDMIPGCGYTEWKGRKYKTLPHNHPVYFEKQPWEREAKELQPILYKYLESEVNRYAD